MRIFCGRIIWLLFCGCLLLACQPIHREVRNSVSDNSRSEEQMLRKLVQRILSPVLPGAPEPKAPTLDVGKVPTDLAFDLSLPEGSVIVGSTTQNWMMGNSTGIFLDVPMSPMAALAYYTQTLQSQEFTPPDSPAPVTGNAFVPLAAAQGVTLCNKAKKLSVWLVAKEIKEQWSDVRLTITDYKDSPCGGSGNTIGLLGMLPQLVIPGEAQMTNGGGGMSSTNEVYSTADLETDLSITALGADFDQQLEKAKWVKGIVQQDKSTAWSTWQVMKDNEEWSGSLIILVDPVQPKHKFVLLRILRQE